jgi:hypothetical protein
MATRELMRDLAGNLRVARGWIAAQFIGFPLIVFVGIGWTRLPEKHWWQVALSLLLPLLLLVAALVLKAGTVRCMLSETRPRVSLIWGALALIVVMVVAWLAWALLDGFDDKIFLLASYLNSKAPAWFRGRLFTYEHFFLWLTRIEWFLRWIVIPALLVPLGAASAVSAFRLNWRAVFRTICDWRWLLIVLILALLGVYLPGHFFTDTPHGTLAAQIWAIVLKLIGAYLLGFFCWVLLLAWVCALLKRHQPSKPQ